MTHTVRTAGLFFALSCVSKLHGQAAPSDPFQFPAEMTSAGLAPDKRQAWLLPPGETLTADPWWARKERSLKDRWWTTGGRNQFETVLAFQVEARSFILPDVGKKYDSAAALEALVDSTSLRDEFETRRQLQSQLDLFNHIRRRDWSEQHFITVSGATRGRYDFEAGGYLLNTPRPAAAILEKPNGLPECGAIVKTGTDLRIPVMSVFNENFTTSTLGSEPAVRFDVDAGKLFVAVDQERAETWSKDTDGDGVLISWVTPVNFFCGGTDIPLAAYCGLVCQVKRSALYFPKKSDKERYVKVTEWNEGDPGYENRILRRSTLQARNLIPLNR